MVPDTNILIAMLLGEETVSRTMSEWKEEGRVMFLSSVVEAELLSFNKWSVTERRHAIEFLERDFVPVAFDRSLARVCAEIRRDTKMKLPDAAIAATALLTGTPLVTRNTRDFKNIRNLSIISL